MEKLDELTKIATDKIKDMLDAVAAAEQAKIVEQLIDIGVLMVDETLPEDTYRVYVCKNWDKHNDEDFVPEIEGGTVYAGQDERPVA